MGIENENRPNENNNCLGRKAVNWLNNIGSDRSASIDFLASHANTARQLAEAMRQDGIDVVGVLGTSDFHKVLDTERLANGHSLFPAVGEVLSHKYSICNAAQTVIEMTASLPDLDLIPIVDGQSDQYDWGKFTNRTWGDANYTYHPLYFEPQTVVDSFPRALPVDIGILELDSFTDALRNLDYRDPRFFDTQTCLLIRDGINKRSKNRPLFMTAHAVAHAVPVYWNNNHIDLYRLYRTTLIEYYRSHKMEGFLTGALLNENWKKSYPRFHSDPTVQRSLYTRWESGKSGNILTLVE